MAEQGGKKEKKGKKTEAQAFQVVEVDPKELKKKMEEAVRKGLGIFPGRPGRGPCGGCDVVMSPHYPRYR